MMHHKIKTSADILLGLMLGAAFVFGMMFVLKGFAPSDIVSPYLAAWFFDNGEFAQIYNFDPALMFAQNPPAMWVVAAQELGISEDSKLYPYVYPPVWAAILAPVTRVLSIPEFISLAYLVQLQLIYGTIFLAWRLAGKPGFFFLWAIVSIVIILNTLPGLSAIAENQPQILVVFLIFLGFERFQAGHGAMAGIALGLAATIKITPVLLILFFVFNKHWRGFWAMVATGLVMVALSFALAGVGLHLLFIEQLQALRSLVLVSIQNWSFSALTYQLHALSGGLATGSIADGYTAPMPGWISALSGIILIGGLVYWFSNPLHRSPRENALLLLIALIWIALFGPMGWPYYFLPMLYLWPLVFLYLPVWAGFILTAGFVVALNPATLKYIGGLSLDINLIQIYATVMMFLLLIGMIAMKSRARFAIDSRS